MAGVRSLPHVHWSYSQFRLFDPAKNKGRCILSKLEGHDLRQACSRPARAIFISRTVPVCPGAPPLGHTVPRVLLLQSHLPPYPPITSFQMFNMPQGSSVVKSDGSYAEVGQKKAQSNVQMTPYQASGLPMYPAGYIPNYGNFFPTHQQAPPMPQMSPMSQMSQMFTGANLAMGTGFSLGENVVLPFVSLNRLISVRKRLLPESDYPD